MSCCGRRPARWRMQCTRRPTRCMLRWWLCTQTLLQQPHWWRQRRRQQLQHSRQGAVRLHGRRLRLTSQRLWLTNQPQQPGPQQLQMGMEERSRHAALRGMPPSMPPGT